MRKAMSVTFEAILAITLLVVLAACGSGGRASPAAGTSTSKPSTPAPPAVATTVVRWGETVSEPTLLTAADAYLVAHPELQAQYHIQFDWHPFAQGGPMYSAFRGGALDMMDGGADSICNFVQQGIPLVAVKAWNTIPDTWAIGALKSSGYKSLADLKGKSFATLTTSGTSWFAPSLAFQHAGIDMKKDLSIVTLPSPALYTAVQQHKAAAALLQGPNYTKAVQSGQFNILAVLPTMVQQDYGIPYFFLAATSTQKFYQAHPEAVKNAVAALTYVLQNVSTADLAQTLVADKQLPFTQLPVAEVQQELDGEQSQMLLSVSGTQVMSELTQFYSLLYKIGAYKAPVNPSTFWKPIDTNS